MASKPVSVQINQLNLVDKYWVVYSNKQYTAGLDERVMIAVADSSKILQSTYRGGYLFRRNGACEELPYVLCGNSQPQTLYKGTWQIKSNILTLYQVKAQQKLVHAKFEIKYLNAKAMKVKVL